MAKHSAGAMIANVQQVRISGNTFEKNNAYVHGVVAIYNCSDALVNQNTFRKNTGFFGTSSLIVSDTNLKLNDTLFLKNNVDFEESNRPSSYTQIPQEQLIKDHTVIPGVTTPLEFSVSFSAYGKSNVYLDNVAFSDSENEAEILNSTYFTLASLDGYAEESVSIHVKSSCSDARNSAFNTNWEGITFTDDICDVSEYYRHIEVFSPVYQLNKAYQILDQGYNYSLMQVDKNSVVYDPLYRVDCPVSIDSIQPDEPPDYPEPQKPTPQIKKASQQVLIILGVIVGLTLIILVGMAIKFCRQPPDVYIEEDDGNKTNLLEDEDTLAEDHLRP